MATEQGLRYAELTCTPYTSVRPRRATSCGMPIEAYTEAIEDARVAAERDFGLVLRWIYDIPGEFGRARRPTRPSTTRSTTAPTRWSASASAARRSACRGRSSSRTSTRPARPGCTACRTPARPPGRETVWDALTAAAAPSGSATAPRRRRTRRCSRTSPRPASRSRSARRPTSPPGRWPRLEEHPIRAFRDAGVTVTVNSDDPPMFGTTLNREYEIAADLLGLDEAGVADLARTAVRASFADGRRSRRGSSARSTRTPVSVPGNECRPRELIRKRGQLLCIACERRVRCIERACRTGT